MPAKPSATPASRAGVARSPSRHRCDTITTATGVIAFAMPAADEVMCCCASGRSAKGAAYWNSPSTPRPASRPRGTPGRRPVASTQTQQPIAPSATRNAETLSGP